MTDDEPLAPAMRRHPFNAPTSGPDDCLDCGGSYHARHDGRPIHTDLNRGDLSAMRPGFGTVTL